MQFRISIGKKADMTIQKLVGIILAIIVLVIMSFLVYNTFMKSDKNRQGLEDNSVSQLTDGQCEFLGLAQKCMDSCGQDYPNSVKGKCDNPSQVCCKS